MNRDPATIELSVSDLSSTIAISGAAADAERRAAGSSSRRISFSIIWALLVLSLIVMHGNFDRQIVAVLAEPIKASLSLSDVHVSLVTGLAFGLCVAFAMIPAGILADRYDRIYLLAGGIALWSVMTIYGGFAGDFTHLFISRLGVGLGEAILVPTAFSLLGELFDDRRRGSAVAIIVASAPVGLGLASFLGGPLYQFIDKMDLATRAYLAVKPWQATLIVTGIFGLLLTGACLTLRDPRRLHDQSGGQRRDPLEPLKPALQRDAGLYGFFASGFALFSLVGVGAIAWAPAMMTRSFALLPAQTGLLLGGLMIVSGISGAQFAGWLSIQATKSDKDSSMRIMAIASVALALLFATMALLRVPSFAVVVMGSIPFFLYGSSTIGLSLLLRIAPPGLHARLTALLALILAVAGSASGPTVFAYFSDRVFGGMDGMLLSLAFAGSSILFGAAILFLLASNALNRRLKAMPGPC